MIKNNEHYLYVQPVKQNIDVTAYQPVVLGSNIKRFAPVIVKSGEQILRQATFYDETGDFKLEHTERQSAIVNDQTFIYITYDDISINSVYNLTQGVDLSVAGIDNNQVFLNGSIIEHDTIEIKYELNNSYIINNSAGVYSLTTNADYIGLEVIYETDMNTPYYTLDNINFNPHFNDFRNGFLYVTDREYEVNRLDIKLSPKKLYINPEATEQQQANITVKILDKFRNPVITQGVATANQGSIEIINSNDMADIYGNLYCKYTPPNLDITEDTIIITVDGVSESVNINLAMLSSEEFIFLNFPTSQEGYVIDSETIAVRATLLDANFNPISGENISFSFDSDNNSIQMTATTNSAGEAIVNFDPPAPVQDTEFYFVTANYNTLSVTSELKVIKSV